MSIICINLAVILIFCVIPSAFAADYCWVDGYLQYCSAGCCGSSYDRYCCLSGDAGRIAGIVIGCLLGVGAVITILVIIFCCCRKQQGASGRIMNPFRSTATTTMTTTTVGQPGVPMNTPVYPGTYPVGQTGPSVGYSQPYAPQPAQAGYNQPYSQPPVQAVHTEGVSQQYPQRAAEGYQTAAYKAYEEPSAPRLSAEPDVGQPPPYSEVN